MISIDIHEQDLKMK